MTPASSEMVFGIDVSATRFAIACFTMDAPVVAITQRLTAGQQYAKIREALRHFEKGVGEPAAVGIEQPHFGFPRAAYLHGMVVGRTEDAVRNAWPHAPQRFFQPSEWRRIAGVGGRASKDEVREFMAETYGFHARNQDEADAAAVAVAMWTEAYGE